MNGEMKWKQFEKKATPAPWRRRGDYIEDADGRILFACVRAREDDAILIVALRNFAAALLADDQKEDNG